MRGGLMVSWLIRMLFLGAAASMFAAPGGPGTLGSLEGDVAVVRGGALIPSEKIAEGFALEDFDTVLTGKTGRADVKIAASTGIAASVRLDTDTALYIDASNKKDQTVGIELLSGAVTAQVASVFGRSLLEIRTDTGTFTQTGPGFRVVMAPSGETLVLVRGGKVACRSERRVVWAEPGTAIEAAAALKTMPVNVATLDAFESSWLSDKKQVLREGASPLLRRFGNAYQLQLGRFQRAWDRSQREAGGPARSVQASVADLRRAASPLERSMPRVLTLRRLYDEGLIAPTFELSRGYPAKDFFRAWDQESTDWATRLAQARGMYKSVVDGNDGVFPLTSDTSEVTYSSAFFH